MDDLAGRLAAPVQLATDGYKVYLDAVAGAFGNQIDYAMLVKHCGEEPGLGPERKYSRGECVGTHKEAITCEPIEPGPHASAKLPDAARSQTKFRHGGHS